MSKEFVKELDATPSKRIYRSIIADYDLNTAICELIDNSIDVWNATRGGPDLIVSVEIDIEQQKVSIVDNAGGVKESELTKLISPGESSTDGTQESIGIFGVGSKRAVVALSQLVRITSRFHQEGTYRLEYDDEWLQDEDWNLPYHRVDDISASTTKIELSNLRFHIDEDKLNRLRDHLSETYAYFLRDDEIAIILNEKPIIGKFYENWAYPPEYKPTSFPKRLSSIKRKEKIKVEILAGLVREKGVLTDYGVYFYCNKRLICKALRTPEVGFLKGVAGIPHHTMCLARIFVKLNGPSGSMPWTSNKLKIHYNHPTFQLIREDIIRTVETYTKLSKQLHPVFEEKVLPYGTGEIDQIKLKSDESIKPSKLPKIPTKTRKNFKNAVLKLNKNVGIERPWTRGLYESIIAEKIISNEKTLEQKSRISLIILDSTLEIAFKDFLAFEIDQPLGDKKLAELFENRKSVHEKVKQHLQLSPNMWTTIEYFYKLRCELIHRKVNVAIPDEDISRFRCFVMTILNEAFGIQFPEEQHQVV